MNTSEDCFKVLKGECTLPEAMKIFGVSDEEIIRIIDELKSPDRIYSYSHSYMLIGNIYKYMAYQKLVEIGEISADEVYYSRGTPLVGDLGFKGDGTWRWVGDKSEFCYKHTKIE